MLQPHCTTRPGGSSIGLQFRVKADLHCARASPAPGPGRCICPGSHGLRSHQDPGHGFPSHQDHQDPLYNIISSHTFPANIISSHTFPASRDAATRPAEPRTRPKALAPGHLFIRPLPPSSPPPPTHTPRCIKAKLARKYPLRTINGKAGNATALCNVELIDDKARAGSRFRVQGLRT